jgi:hypothetical protein
MTTNTIHNNKLYHLIWYKYAKFLVNKTSYGVFFVSSDNPMVRVTKENLQHFKKLSEIKTKYFDNKFVMEIELPAMEINIKQDHNGNHINFNSNQMSSSFRGFSFKEFEDWRHKKEEDLMNEQIKPIREARDRGENPVWDVDLDAIRKKVREDYELFCGISPEKDKNRKKNLNWWRDRYGR